MFNRFWIIAAILAVLTPAIANAQARLFTAMGPTVRTQVPGETRTAIMAIINNGDAAATNCRVISGVNNPAIQYEFFEVQISNNEVTNNGPRNAAFEIPAGQTRYAAVAYNLLQNFGETGRILSVRQNLVCDNVEVRGVTYLSELQLVQLSGTPADVISAIITPSLDGVLRINTNGGAQRAAAAMVNIGSGGNPEQVTVTPYFPNMSGYVFGFANYGGPFELLVCETNPSNGQCLALPTESLSVSIGDTARTFAVVLRDTLGFGARLFPSQARVGLQFHDQSGNLVGESNIAYTAPAETPRSNTDGNPTTVAEYAGIYTLSTASNDGLQWNGSQDFGSGYAVIDPNGEIWMLTIQDSLRLDPQGTEQPYQISQSGFGTLSLGEVSGDTQVVTASLAGFANHSANNSADVAEASFTAAFSGRGAPRGFFFGGLTRSSMESNNPAISTWPETTNIRANIDAHTRVPVSLTSLAGQYDDLRHLADSSQPNPTNATIAADGSVTGVFERFSGGEQESCDLTGNFVQPDAALNVLRFSGNIENCSLASAVHGIAALNEAQQVNGFIPGSGAFTRNVEVLTLLMRNAGTGRTVGVNFNRDVPG